MKKLISLLYISAVIFGASSCSFAPAPKSEFDCLGQNRMCPNKQADATDFFCDSCDPDGNNIEGTQLSDTSVETPLPDKPTPVPDNNLPTISNNTNGESIVAHVVSPEFKEAMDSYEAFFDEYIAFMNKFAKTDDVMLLMDDYAEYMQQYAETMQELSEIDSSTLSDVDYAYYVEVSARITKKLLEVDNLGSDNNTHQSTSAPDPDTTPNEKTTLPLPQDELKPTETPATTESRNEQALKSAKEIESLYTTVYPSIMREILIEDYGYTETQAHYAIVKGDIDWNSYAVLHAENFYWSNNGKSTKEEVAYHLGIELGYTQDAIDYALKANASMFESLSAVGTYIFGNETLSFYDDGTLVLNSIDTGIANPGQPFTLTGTWTQTEDIVYCRLFDNTGFEWNPVSATLSKDGISFWGNYYSKVN